MKKLEEMRRPTGIAAIMCLASYFLHLAHNNFKLDGNGGEFSKRVENTMGTVEIARLEQISISHSVFKYLYCRHVSLPLSINKQVDKN